MHKGKTPMKRWIAAIVAGGALAAGIASTGQAAYPQTRPNAGRLQDLDAGVVTKAKNGRRVKCKLVSGRYHWAYV